jgi:3-oxoacyl-[acyl-carrier protein] reductase
VIADSKQPTTSTIDSGRRPVALVTGAGRTISIGTSVARHLAELGWDVAFTYWTPYDARRPWGAEPDAAATLTRALGERGAATVAIEADLASTNSPEQIFDQVEQRLGNVTALVMCHCEAVPTGLLDTTIESFDRHFAVNTRAAWLMIREYGRRFRGEHGIGRVISFTGDHTVGHIAYGASKGALDRITLAAAQEFADLGVRANVINPGPVDTGWMNDEIRASGARQTPAGRVGTPQDCANIVGFLCSPEGEWINGQLLYSNGGYA